jgi:uncharacterized peroxidase-related enzyme
MKRLLPSLPEVPDLGDVFKAYPAAVPDILRLNDAIMCEEGAVHQGDRELIAAYVSALNACQYCTGSHMNAAEAFGVDPTVLTDLLKDLETAPIEEPLKPLLRYVEKLTRTPARLTEQDAKAVYAAGWSEAALFDAVQVCALFSFMNRIVEGTGVAADTSEGRAVSDAEKKARRARRYSDWGRAIGVME